MNVIKDIVKPILITLAVLLLLMTIVFVILHFSFPLIMGKMCYKLGMNKPALYYLEQSYEKSMDYGELYNVLNLSIKLNDDKKVIKYYEIFEQNENYSQFINNIDEENLSQNIKPLALSKLYSEDNFLKNRYAVALINSNEITKAYTYAYDNFSVNVDIRFISPYVFTYVITTETLNEFNKLNVFVAQLEEYFNNLIIEFDNNKADISKKVEMLVVGNRINEVANNLKSINNFSEALLTITNEEINESVRAINTAMAQLI